MCPSILIRYIPRSGISRSEDMCIFKFLQLLPSALHQGGIIHRPINKAQVRVSVSNTLAPGKDAACQEEANLKLR